VLFVKGHNTVFYGDEHFEVPNYLLRLVFCLISYHVGAQEAFLDKTLLYRDEVVKKCIYQLAIPCYSVILSTPQTAISLAHAKKVMVKLALTGEEKVIVMNCPAVNDNFRISVGKKKQKTLRLL